MEKIASPRPYVAYYRVSTKRQGESGLGLEAQQATVLSFVSNRGTIVAEFTEVESGKKDHRPQLEAAIAKAKRLQATLVIAKLDRLSRNVSFTMSLRDSKVDFVACDIPDANTLTIGIFAVIAQHERETISARTRAALGALKARGVVLGKPENLTHEARIKGTRARQAAARTLTRIQAADVAQTAADAGATLREIAAKLNGLGYTTPRGGQYHPTSVARLLRFNTLSTLHDVEDTGPLQLEAAA